MSSSAFLLLLLLSLQFAAAVAADASATAFPWKGISGSFLDVAYDNRLHYANAPARAFTCTQWSAKMREWAAGGLDLAVFQAVHDTRWGAYYPSAIAGLTPWNGTCGDVVAAVLAGAAAAGSRVMLSCEFVGTDSDGTTPALMAGRLAILRELAARYGSAPAFAGWYFSSEAYITPYFTPSFLSYVSTLAGAARSATPGALVLVSPYGTRNAVADGTFVDQLRALRSAGVDVIAYQDEVGCVRDEWPLDAVSSAWATLATAHANAGAPKLWANVEAFTWQGGAWPNNASSPLVPAAWPRVLAQLAAAAPHVARVITFTAEAMLDAPGSPIPWGPPDAARLYASLHDAFPIGGGGAFVPSTPYAALLGDAVGQRAWAHAAVGAAIAAVAPAPLPSWATTAVLTDGACGGPSPWSSAGAATGSSERQLLQWVAWVVPPPPAAHRVDIIVDLGTPLRVTSAAVHALIVSPVWYVDGSSKSPVSRNVTARAPTRVVFWGSNSSLPPGSAQWFLLGETPPLEPWGSEGLDVRTEVLLLWLATDAVGAVRFVWAAVEADPAPELHHNALQEQPQDVLLLSELAVNPDIAVNSPATPLPFPFTATLAISPEWAVMVHAPSAHVFSFNVSHLLHGVALALVHTPMAPLLSSARVNASYSQSGGTFIFSPGITPPLSSCSALTLSAAASAGGVATLSGGACSGGSWSWTFEAESSGHVSWAATIDAGAHKQAEPDTASAAVIISMTVPPNAPLLGLGTQFSALDMRGRVWPVWSREQGVGRGLQPVTAALDALVPGSGGDATTTYSQIPLLYIATPYETAMPGVGASAVWLEGLAYAEFDLTARGRAVVSALGVAARGRVTAGATLSATVESYTAYSGRPPPSPAWVEEGAIVGLEGGTEAVLDALATIDAAMGGADAPISAIWLQDWSGARNNSGSTSDRGSPYYGVYWSWQLNASVYPKWHTELLPALDARGTRVCVYVNPMLMAGPLLNEATAAEFLVRTEDGALFDFGGGVRLVDVFNPAAAKWFAGVIAENVLGASQLAARASCWMHDFGEAYPPTARGATVDSHGSYPAAWAAVAASAVALADRSDDAFYWMRSVSPQSPRITPAFWLGDQLTTFDAFDGLASAVVALVTSSLSGAGITHSDIGGYTAVELRASGISIARSKELFLRWAEFAAYGGFAFRTHLGSLPRASWQLTSDAETVRHFFAQARAFVSLREYRSQVRANATLYGTPPYRATAAVFPGASWSLTEQFLFGDNLLVAPVLRAGADTVRVWLPAGTLWRHALNASATYEGAGEAVTIAAPIGHPCALWRV